MGVNPPSLISLPSTFCGLQHQIVKELTNVRLLGLEPRTYGLKVRCFSR